MKLSEELQWRGFTNQTTLKDVSTLDNDKLVFYFGVDPSAPSMTIGNLAAMMMVRKFLSAGHQAIILVGGATGLIGDPDGKAVERELKTVEEVTGFKEKIIAQYQKVLGGYPFEVVDNYSWFQDMGYLNFLRDVGKHVPMRQMLGRDFVQSRLSEEGAGISYAEFSYVLIQAYDFLHLNEKYGVSLQLCGSDQWGNSIAGVDLIRRKNGNEAHVWSTPLVINKATGMKFGKSEEGAVWLDSNLTSVFKFYQFWLNLDDEGVEYYLKIYTELSKTEIDQVLEEFRQAPHTRKAQKVLAYEATKLVHGEEQARQALAVTEVLFGAKEFLSLSDSEKQLLAVELPSAEGSADFLQDLVGVGLASSKTEARKFVESGSIAVNGEKISTADNVLLERMNLIKRGKNSFAIITSMK